LKAVISRVLVVFFALLIVGSLPKPASADTYTLDSYSLDSFTLGSGTFDASFSPSEVILTADTLLDYVTGYVVPQVTVEDFASGGALLATFTFDNAVVIADSLGGTLSNPEDDITVAFQSYTDPPAVPESSSLGMLAIGLFCVAGMSRRKMFALHA